MHSLFVGNSLIADPLTIANTFNTYFTTIADETASLTHPVTDPESIQTLPTQSTFDIYSTPVTEDKILNCIKKLEN